MAALREAITNAVMHRDTALDHLSSCGFLELTIPEKPRSKNQRYRLSATGLVALKNYNKGPQP